MQTNEETGEAESKEVRVQGDQILTPTGEIISEQGGSIFTKTMDFMFGSSQSYRFPGCVRPKDVFNTITQLGVAAALE